VNPDEQFKGRENFFQRKAKQAKPAGLPSDRKKSEKPAPSPKSVVIPKYSSGSEWVQFDRQGVTNSYDQLVSAYLRMAGPSRLLSRQSIDPKFSGKEFAATSAKGARSFKIDPLGRLTGIHYRQVWTPGENQAECRADLGNHAEGQFPQCRCGFYGYYDGSNDYHDRGLVSGVVEGYGEAVLGSQGFRVMKARILALTINDTVPAPVARLVARNYAEIPIFETFSRMVSEFPTDFELTDKQAPSPDTDPDFWTRNA